jgi:hypothetical protein
LIAIDRYFFIVHSTSTQIDTAQAFLLSGVSLGISIILSFPLFSLTRLEVNYSLLTETAYSYCYEGWEAEYGRLPYSSTCLLIQYLIPSAIVALAYTRISQKLDHQTNSVFSSHKKSRQLARRKRTNSLLIVVSFIFFLSWAPINTLNIISDLSGKTKVLPLTVFSILLNT